MCIRDSSDMRRGTKALHVLFGNRKAVLMGDYILSKAILLAVQMEEPLVLEILSHVGESLTEGELMQDDASQLAETSEEWYYDIIRRKTASLLAASATLGAILAGRKDDETTLEISEATLRLGMAFQIRDDIFDYLPTPELGKPAGNDLREHKVTLPLIYALEHSGRKGERARRVLRQSELSDEDIRSLTDFAIECGGIDYAEQEMRRLLDEAKEHYTRVIPEGRSLELLYRLCDYIAEREK
ncbi:polyprenyl synthetase family protein [uncultured Porphyromonas sp.]|uniref:polyprenyl synthetase family protein n=1 Tax=uncultured Porphyromonas sp. TaxID=159274 RepID=UPI0025941A97|nr:polyprenyl synthetase family protein [uncultured Porphyromonas sp.]